MVCKDSKAEQNTRSDSADHNQPPPTCPQTGGAYNGSCGVDDLLGQPVDGQTPHIGTNENEDLLHSRWPITHRHISAGNFFQTAKS